MTIKLIKLTLMEGVGNATGNTYVNMININSLTPVAYSMGNPPKLFTGTVINGYLTVKENIEEITQKINQKKQKPA